MWTLFRDAFSCGMKECIPAVKSNNWKKKESWSHPIDKDARQLISRKHRLWTRYQKTRDANIFNEYKSVRNLVRSKSRKIGAQHS